MDQLLFGEIFVAVPQGASVGATVKPNATSGGNFYVAFVAYEDEHDH